MNNYFRGFYCVCYNINIIIIIIINNVTVYNYNYIYGDCNHKKYHNRYCYIKVTIQNYNYGISGQPNAGVNFTFPVSSK